MMLVDEDAWLDLGGVGLVQVCCVMRGHVQVVMPLLCHEGACASGDATAVS
jgi:hypothetical protein